MPAEIAPVNVLLAICSCTLFPLPCTLHSCGLSALHWPQFIQEKFPDHGVLGEEGGIMGAPRHAPP